MSVKHSGLSQDDGIHTPFAWVWADATERTAESVTALDINKIGWQEDGSIWVLLTAGPTWLQIADGALNLSPQDFGLIYGSPAQVALGGTGNGLRVWAFDDTADEGVGHVRFWSGPGSANPGDFSLTLYLTMASATSGSVRLKSAVGSIDIAEQVTLAADESLEADVAVPGTSGDLFSHTFTFDGLSIESDQIFRLTVERLGSHANDNATGDMYLVAVRFTFS